MAMPKGNQGKEGHRTMKSRKEQRAEILKGLFSLRGQHFRLHRISWKDKTDPRYKAGMNYFYSIRELQKIILQAMEVEPETKEYVKDSYKGRNASYWVIKYSAGQTALADKVIRNMAIKGYIELKHDPDTKYSTNNWSFRILKTR